MDKEEATRYLKELAELFINAKVGISLTLDEEAARLRGQALRMALEAMA